MEKVFNGRWNQCVEIKRFFFLLCLAFDWCFWLVCSSSFSYFDQAVSMVHCVYLCVSIYQTCWKIAGALFLCVWNGMVAQAGLERKRYIERESGTRNTHHDHRQFCLRNFLHTKYILWLCEFVSRIACLAHVRVSTLCVSDRRLRWFVFYFRWRFLDAVHLIHSNRCSSLNFSPNSLFYSSFRCL